MISAPENLDIMIDEIAAGWPGALREVLEDTITEKFDEALSLALDTLEVLTRDEEGKD